MNNDNRYPSSPILDNIINNRSVINNALCTDYPLGNSVSGPALSEGNLRFAINSGACFEPDNEFGDQDYIGLAGIDFNFEADVPEYAAENNYLDDVLCDNYLVNEYGEYGKYDYFNSESENEYLNSKNFYINNGDKEWNEFSENEKDLELFTQPCHKNNEFVEEHDDINNEIGDHQNNRFVGDQFVDDGCDVINKQECDTSCKKEVSDHCNACDESVSKTREAKNCCCKKPKNCCKSSTNTESRRCRSPSKSSIKTQHCKPQKETKRNQGGKRSLCPLPSHRKKSSSEHKYSSQSSSDCETKQKTTKCATIESLTNNSEFDRGISDNLVEMKRLNCNKVVKPETRRKISPTRCKKISTIIDDSQFLSGIDARIKEKCKQSKPDKKKNRSPVCHKISPVEAKHEKDHKSSRGAEISFGNFTTSKDNSPPKTKKCKNINEITTLSSRKSEKQEPSTRSTYGDDFSRIRSKRSEDFLGSNSNGSAKISSKMERSDRKGDKYPSIFKKQISSDDESNFVPRKNGKFTVAKLRNGKLETLFDLDPEFSVKDICSYENCVLILLSNGEVLKMNKGDFSVSTDLDRDIIHGRQLSKGINKLDRSQGDLDDRSRSDNKEIMIDRIFPFAGYLYGLSNSQLLLLNPDTLLSETLCWSKLPWSPKNIIALSTTLDQENLWLCSKDGWNIYNVSEDGTHDKPNRIKSGKYIPGFFRIYGDTVEHYIEIDENKNQAILWNNKVEEKVYDDVVTAFLLPENEEIIVNSGLAKIVKEVRLVEQEPIFIVRQR